MSNQFRLCHHVMLVCRLVCSYRVSNPRLVEHLVLSFHVLSLHLIAPEQEKRSTAVLDSAKQNLASSFVNAFVNAGFCKATDYKQRDRFAWAEFVNVSGLTQDELMTIADSKWVYKNKAVPSWTEPGHKACQVK